MSGWGRNPAKRLTGAPRKRRNDAVKRRDNYTCQNKRCGVVTVKGEVDHIIPLSQGGGESLDNCQYLCRACNQSKGVAESRGIRVVPHNDFDRDLVRTMRSTDDVTNFIKDFFSKKQ